MVLLNLMIKPLWLVIENLLQNRLGHEIWGTYSALSSFAIALTVLTDFGINQYTIKSMASDLTKFKAWFPKLLGFKIALMLAYPLLIFLLGAITGYSSEELIWLMIISLSLSALQLVQFLRSSFQAFQYFKLDGFASVLDKILLAAFCLTYLSFNTQDFRLFLTLPTAATLISLLVFLIILFKMYGGVKIQWDWNFTKRILQLSFPFALVTIVYAVHDKIDKVMLEKISGPYENGLYSAAARWADALMMYTWIVMGLYYARFAKHIREPEKLTMLLRNGQLLGSLPMIPAFLILYFQGKELTAFLLPRSTALELEVIHSCLIWLALATLVNSSLVIYSTLLTATGHEKPVTRMVVGSILIKTLLNLILIPIWGGIAAAGASFISYFLLSASYLYITNRYTRILPEYRDLLRLGFIFLLSFGSGWILQRTEWGTYALPLALGVFILLGILMGFIRISRIKELVQ